VHPGAEELGRVYSPASCHPATPTAFAAALDNLDLKAASGGGLRSRARGLSGMDRTADRTAGRRQFRPVWCGCANICRPTPSCATPGELRGMDHRFFRLAASARMWRRPRAPWLWRPAALAMKRLHPTGGGVSRRRRTFSDNGQEFATRFSMARRSSHHRRQRHVRHHPHLQERNIPAASRRPICQSGFSGLTRGPSAVRRLGRTPRGFPDAFKQRRPPAGRRSFACHRREAITPTRTRSQKFARKSVAERSAEPDICR